MRFGAQRKYRDLRKWEKEIFVNVVGEEHMNRELAKTGTFQM